MDVTDAASVRSATAQVVAELGGLDVWVNNAGVFPSIPVLDTEDDAWEQVFAVNTRGVFNGSREAARRMASNGLRRHRQHRLDRRIRTEPPPACRPTSARSTRCAA